MLIDQELEQRWRRFCGAHGCDDRVRADAAWTLLVSLYARPERAYHSLQHVGACLSLFDEWRDSVNDPASMELALWAHDAIYDPVRHDNEAQSAVIGRMLAEDLEIGDGGRVHDLVMCTIHGEDSLTADHAMIVDIDLSILGAEPGIYDDYARGIRDEYSFVDQDEYRAGRASVLRQFLKRDQLYRTERAQTRFEEAARRNLQREIAYLEGVGSE